MATTTETELRTYATLCIERYGMRYAVTGLHEMLLEDRKFATVERVNAAIEAVYAETASELGNDDLDARIEEARLYGEDGAGFLAALMAERKGRIEVAEQCRREEQARVAALDNAVVALGLAGIDAGHDGRNVTINPEQVARIVAHLPEVLPCGCCPSEDSMCEYHAEEEYLNSTER